MKKILAFIVCLTMLIPTFLFNACGDRKETGEKDTVTIYTSSEDYTVKFLNERLPEIFPDYNINIVYDSTSNIANKIINEGADSECDIIFAEEYAYLIKMFNAGVLYDFNGRYDMNKFEDDMVTDATKSFVIPNIRTAGAVIINNTILAQKGISKPTCYADLLDAKYKNLIAMPSPKSSGTGYMFLLSLVNEMGENEAFEYFDSLASSKNMLEFTKSGSGPVNKLKANEVAVGFGMVSQAVEQIQNGNTNLEIILSFEEGAPVNLYGGSIVKGKERESVLKVMDYFYDTLVEEICSMYYPEPIIKGKAFNKEGFPKNIRYSDMSNNTLENKERLLAKWTH